jgi:hypothetical protein
MLPYAILGKTNIKLLLENAGNNEENNCKPDHNRSKSKSFLIFKINEIKAAHFEPPYLQI